MILESKAAAQHRAGQISVFPQVKNIYHGRVRIFLAAVFFSLLTACGGGGGGENAAAFDDTTLRSGYTGNTNPAALTQTNAKELSANVFYAQEMGGSFIRSQTAKVNKRTDLVSRALQLASYADKFPALNSADQNYSRSNTRAIIDERAECESGYVQYSGDINDNTGTGTVTSTFYDCLDAGEVLTGKLSADIISNTDMTIRMEDFTLSSTDYKISINGSLRIEDVYESSWTTHLTMNMLFHEHYSDEQIKTENLVISSTNVNGDAHISVSGRVYETNHGYIDIHTVTPFVLNYNVSQQYFGGDIILTGKDGATISISPNVDGVHVTLALDIDGDGEDEMEGTSTWDDVYYAADNDNDNENNTAPIAQITELNSAALGIPLALDASNSSDADGDLLSYQWQIITSPNASVATISNPTNKVASFTPDVPGDYRIQLIVGDGYTQSQPASAQISVANTEQTPVPNNSNHAPTAQIVEPTSVAVGMSLALDASNSSDADGDLLSYQWQITAAPYGSVASISLPTNKMAAFSPDVTGDYSIQLIVDDGYAQSQAAVAQISVTYTYQALDFNIVDAEYSDALERVVMISAEPSRLYTLDTETLQLTSLGLPLTPTSVSVGPDGRYAAIGHDGYVSYINLTNNTMLKIIPTSTEVMDVVLDGNGYIHAFPIRDQWERIRTLNIATGVETLHSGNSIRAGTKAKLHPNGQWIYGADNGLSPSDIEKYDVSAGAASYVRDSPYHGNYPMCGNLWISDDGLRIFTACGKVFRSSAVATEDMTYNGSLANVTDLTSVDHSQVSSKVIAIPAQRGYYNTEIVDNRVNLYDYDYLTYEKSIFLPEFIVADNRYQNHGKFAFFNSDGTKHIVIAESDAAALNAYSVFISGDTALEFPAEISGPTKNFSAGGEHTCAIIDGNVNCWGANYFGETDVPVLTNPVKVSTGGQFSCALDDSGVVCWGAGEVDSGSYPNFGQLIVPELQNPIDIDAGHFHACAIDDTGVVCWGGDSSNETAVPYLINPRQLSAGMRYTCVLDDTGVVCWGSNADNRLTIPALINPVAVSAGGSFSCALDNTGVVCWGNNNDGQLNVPELVNPVSISSGSTHACAIDDTGVVCWGDDGMGQASPPSITNPVQISAGLLHTCAMSDVSTIPICWGVPNRYPVAEVNQETENTQPFANNSNVYLSEDRSAQITVRASDLDGNQLEYVLVNGPSNGVISGSLPNITYTPGNNFSGTDTIEFIVNDGMVDSNKAVVSFFVSEVNDAPLIGGQSSGTAYVDHQYYFKPRVSDVDDELFTYSILNRPAWAAFNSDTGELTGTPTNADIGQYENITISVSDGEYSADLVPFDLFVNAGSVLEFDPPPISGGSMSLETYLEDGLEFTGTLEKSFFHSDSGMPLRPDSGSGYFGVSRFYTQFQMQDGSSFDLISVDLAEYSTVYSVPATISFICYRQDQTSVTATFITDGLIANLGIDDFELFEFPAGCSDLEYVEIEMDLPFSMDNLVIEKKSNNTIVYENDFSSSSLNDFIIGEVGVATVQINAEKLQINPGSGYLNRGYVAINLADISSTYSSAFASNNAKITWSFNVSNIDLDVCGSCNNLFFMNLFSEPDPSSPTAFGYSLMGGGYVGNRMLLLQSALAHSTHGPVYVEMIDVTDGLAPQPSNGAFKLVYYSDTNLWELYFSQATSVLDPRQITTLVGSSVNSGFVNEQLPYLILGSQSGDSAIFDNLTVTVEPIH